eukprot:5103616-Ditylum_brightwellii.AAC.1
MRQKAKLAPYGMGSNWWKMMLHGAKRIIVPEIESNKDGRTFWRSFGRIDLTKVLCTALEVAHQCTPS